MSCELSLDDQKGLLVWSMQHDFLDLNLSEFGKLRFILLKVAS